MHCTTRDILGFHTRFQSSDRTLADYLERLYQAFPVAAKAEHTVIASKNDDGKFELRVDENAAGDSERPEALVSTLVHHLNRRVAIECKHVLVHAGGVEHNGVGVALPANMESGKTTLTTGLVRAGFSYLTDEAVAIDRETLQVVPYPKPLSIDKGAWFLFPELEPHEPFATDEYKTVQWQVPPAAIRADPIGKPCPVRFIIFPAYEEDAVTELVPLTRAEALVELAKNTFRFNEEGRPTLDVLAAVIRNADVYRLPNGNLDDAVARITDLVDQADR